MKIKDASLDTGVPLAHIRNQELQQKASSPSAPGINQPKDRIELSEKARYLLDLKDECAAAPEVRSDLVQGIKQAIKEGRYVLDSREIAEKILKDSLEEG
jgi:flagellar biosynthesis anti-sigma factor FlgM